MSIDRKLILNILSELLQSVVYVNALWLEGADSLNKVDEFSDIDLWIDVNDGFEDKSIKFVRQELLKIGPLDFEFETKHPHPKIRQIFFHLKDTPKYMIIDMCLQSHSRDFWFTKEMEGEEAVVLFDKKNVIRFLPLNKAEFNKKLEQRKEYLLKKYQIMKIDVEKELERNDYLGALNFYLPLTRVFIDLLRIEHSPTKHEFGLKHSKRDFPENVQKILINVLSFNTVSDLKENLKLMDLNI